MERRKKKYVIRKSNEVANCEKAWHSNVFLFQSPKKMIPDITLKEWNCLECVPTTQQCSLTIRIFPAANAKCQLWQQLKIAQISHKLQHLQKLGELVQLTFVNLHFKFCSSIFNPLYFQLAWLWLQMILLQEADR